MSVYEDKYNEYKELADKHLLDFLPEIDPKSITLYDAMKYSLTAGGKRLRPVLLLAACEFVGGNVQDALPYAMAVEYIHTYSLIHDDLPAMDDGKLRKGIPTNHLVFGEATAILAGDGLLSSAFEAMSKDMLLYFDDPERLKRRVRACYELAKGSGCRGIVAGQIADIEAEGHECSGEMLEYIDINKTADLIIAAVKAGAYIGGGSKEMIADLGYYAECLGLAFQIRDDILDVIADEKELGKTIGNDEKNNKNTYVSIHGMDSAQRYLEDLSEKAKAVIVDYGDIAEFLVAIVDKMAVRSF